MKLQAFHKIPAPDDKARCKLLIDTNSVVYVQPKINGVSCHIFFTRDPEIFIFQTKREKLWRPGFFPQEVYDSLKELRAEALPDLTLHCEIAALDVNMPLATLAGHVNVNSAKCSLEAGHFRFYVYDVSRSNVAEPFNFRNKRLNTLRKKDANMFKFLYTTYCHTPEDLEHAYETAINAGGEGVVYRVDPNYYFDGDSETQHAWKRPRYYTAEGTVIAAVEGEGKRKGMLGSFVVRLDNEEKTILSVGGGEGLDDALLTRYWENRDIIIRSQLTFRYSELSRLGTPLRPQIVTVRNYE